MFYFFLVLVVIGIYFAITSGKKHLSHNELVTRFSFRSGNISRLEKKGNIGEIKIKPALFEPKDNKASVFQISGFDDRSIWFIGKWVEDKRKKNSKGSGGRLRGRADILVSKVLELELDVVPEEPPPKHCNIEGFPSESASYNMQQKLANDSVGFLVRDIKPPIDNILSETTKVSSLYN